MINIDGRHLSDKAFMELTETCANSNMIKKQVCLFLRVSNAFVSDKLIRKRHWCRGNIFAFQASAPGSIPG